MIHTPYWDYDRIRYVAPNPMVPLKFSRANSLRGQVPCSYGRRSPKLQA